jgi:hypothetical protein
MAWNSTGHVVAIQVEETGPRLPHANFIGSAQPPFQMFTHQRSAVRHQITVLGGEGGGEVAVNIQFANDLPADKYRKTISDLVSVEHAR